MKTIHTTRGYTAKVDDADYEWLSRYKWCSTGPGYICRNTPRSQGHKTVFMHRMITGASKGYHVDHINHDPSDNRRSNIRVVTPGQNSRNRSFARTGSGYLGVYPAESGRWYCLVKTTKYKRIGTYDTPEEAAIARDKALDALGDVHSMRNIDIMKARAA